MKNNYKYFENRQCKYYPCHNTDNINCMFCFCPLYFLECNGNFKILDNGVKDCSECLIPHKEDNYDYIIKILKEKNNEKGRNCQKS